MVPFAWGFGFFRGGWVHAVEVPLKGIDVRGPETPELGQPHIDLLERFRPEPVKTALGVHCGFNEAGVAQHAQVLGHGRLGHTEPALDFPHGLVGRDEETEDGAAIGLGNDFEYGFHSSYIPQQEYTCQGI